MLQLNFFFLESSLPKFLLFKPRSFLEKLHEDILKKKTLALDKQRASYVLNEIQKLYAIGRKNYLFAGTHNAAKRTACSIPSSLTAY